MDAAEFERSLASDGFRDVDTRRIEPNRMTPEHEHPFDVRALVLSGDITLGVAGATHTYRAGDVFTMAATCRHTEAVGPDGVEYLVGRRHAAAA
jgi:quercetin dioxygenase-like cupin family protein